MTAKPTVLLVDDEDFVRESLAAVLEAEGFAPVGATSARQAREILGRERPDLVVTDLRMPLGDGHDLIDAARELAPDVPIVVLTGAGTVADAVRAFKRGIYDFLEKPVEADHFVHVLRRALEHAGLKTAVDGLRRAVDDLRGARALVGSSPAMERVRTLVAQVAPTDATVLVTGESGTGKELVADAVHRMSGRAARASVRVNCAAVSEALFESEFFGHQRGAFTGAITDRSGHFAAAAGGTLVLDEIGTLPILLQAKLLRVLESGEYRPVGAARTLTADVRIVAITNEDLGGLLRAGRFREDLYHRLNVFPIALPALRDHKSDLAEIASHLLARLRPAAFRDGAALAPDVLAVLASYEWPGNVRELRNVLERCLILGEGRLPDVALLESVLDPPAPAEAAAAPSSFDIRTRTQGLERELLLGALARAGGRKREASELLGIDARNLAYYLRKHGLAAPKGEGG